MKKRLPIILYSAVALVLCAVFFRVLTIYSRPMEDLSLDLSLMNKDAHVTEEDTFDSKGWTVYTRDGETVTPLEPTPSGAHRGIELGETFYYSRVMNEELDSPTLQIGTADRMFSVWLDDELIYTDCPELDNRIGYLTLPMNTVTRQEPITISLPMNFAGKTLTIAQSTPPYAEGSLRAYPASVMLYCGYAYESEIISEVFATATRATLIFAVGLLLLAACIRNRDPGMLCMAVAVFLWMCMVLRDVSFFPKYFGHFVINIDRYARLLATTALLAFLAHKAGRLKPLAWVLTALQGVSVLVSLLFHDQFEASISPAAAFFGFHLMEWISVLGFLAVLILGMVYWRKESPFYRVFAPASLAVTATGWLVLLLTQAEVRATIPIALGSGQVTLLYQKTFLFLITTAMACAVYEAIRLETVRRADRIDLEHRHRLVQSNYENMRLQHQKVMEIRHDMIGHLEQLKAMVDNPRATAYVDELIGQNRQVRSVVQTGNEMLDLILNHKLSEAQDAGIRIDVVKAEAPERLPLSDADLCSLFSNVMSNAVTAAKASGAEAPHIRLDIHVKNSYLAFTCENSADKAHTAPQSKKETVLREHGLGLKIIGGIVESYNGLLEVKQSDHAFEMRIAIPLFNL